MSVEAGGLSAETRTCIASVAMEHPAAFGIGPPPTADDFAGLFGAGIQMNLCLTDEEAAALAGAGGDGLPPPSVIRCMEEQIGSLDDLLAAFLALMGEEPDPSAALGLFAAAQECRVRGWRGASRRRWRISSKPVSRWCPTPRP